MTMALADCRAKIKGLIVTVEASELTNREQVQARTELGAAYIKIAQLAEVGDLGGYYYLELARKSLEWAINGAKRLRAADPVKVCAHHALAALHNEYGDSASAISTAELAIAATTGDLSAEDGAQACEETEAALSALRDDLAGWAAAAVGNSREIEAGEVS
ncbi:hypothetical protein [Nocardia sp. NPDC058497]|uniref:hypothetical protein n=1 Tax=Nocardia sp. NPDC058497 TaxID=3346529 RepID=UPI00365F8F41